MIEADAGSTTTAIHGVLFPALHHPYPTEQKRENYPALRSILLVGILVIDCVFARFAFGLGLGITLQK